MVVAPESLPDVLTDLTSRSGVEEAALLSTCARTEIYLSATTTDEGIEAGMAILLGLNPESRQFIVVREEREAALHIFRVASGMESQVIGEQEIAGQVRTAMQQARHAGSLGPELDALFRSAIQCSRRLKRETNLGRVNVSVAAAAGVIARSQLDIPDSSILIIGAGRVANLLAAEFEDAKVLVIANRTAQVAQGIAAAHGGSVLPLKPALSSLSRFDVVCCATRSRTPVLTEEQLREAGPTLIFDLSVPRNVEPEASSIPNISVFDVDAVQAPSSLEEREDAIAESIVEGEVHDYMSRRSMREVAPIIRALKNHVDLVRRAELERVGRRLEGMDPAQQRMVEELTQRLIDRMFHHLVVRLKLAALTDPELVRAAEFFFAHGPDSLFPSSAALDPEPALGEGGLVDPVLPAELDA